MARSPFNRIKQRRQNSNRGRVAEKRTAERFDARTTPGSGNLDSKADFPAGCFLIENKSTLHQSYKLLWSDLKKINQQALEVGKSPALALQFINPDGSPIPQGSWVVMPERIFNEIFEDTE